MVPATEEDYATEYLSLDLAAAVVDSLDAAIAHIRGTASGHTEAIVTESTSTARSFVARVDAAAVMVNASTRFTDGGEFGFGAEIGISTQKLHARGPMGLPELTSHQVRGDRGRSRAALSPVAARRSAQGAQGGQGGVHVEGGAVVAGPATVAALGLGQALPGGDEQPVVGGRRRPGAAPRPATRRRPRSGPVTGR